MDAGPASRTVTRGAAISASFGIVAASGTTGVPIRWWKSCVLVRGTGSARASTDRDAALQGTGTGFEPPEKWR